MRPEERETHDREVGDEGDAAQAREAEQRDDAISEVRRQVQHGDWRVMSAKWCETPACGVRIPDERRKAVPGVRLCVECAGELEKRTEGW